MYILMSCCRWKGSQIAPCEAVKLLLMRSKYMISQNQQVRSVGGLAVKVVVGKRDVAGDRLRECVTERESVVADNRYRIEIGHLIDPNARVTQIFRKRSDHRSAATVAD